MSEFRSGFASLIGRPNAGKSTLLNALSGEKLAIVSDKPQTTRTTIQGVVNLPGAQIVFIDTPGIHKSTNLFNKRMMETVRTALADRDVLLYVADASLPFSGALSSEDAEAVSVLKELSTPVLLLANKIDRVQDKRKLLPFIEQYKAVREFDEYIPVSATTGEGLERVRDAIVSRLPEGPAYFPAEHLTDQPERFLAGELIREQILRQTRQEVPHSVAVLIERWEESPKITRIAATIYVERDGQKAIVIGAGGAALKIIGTRARHEIEKMLGCKVFLELFVKVQKDWRENPEFLNAIDWRSMRGGELDSDDGSKS
ncbi:MAG TPA: GTPase Era [Bryobacteraceae bacterium]|jgi:GTP-binding protein Era|nr:GTPase Era [Bryobacteraceae bacterium]